MRTLLTHRTHRLLGDTEGQGQVKDQGTATCIRRSAEEKQKLVDVLCDNEILYNKRLMDYKYRSKREAVWESFVRTTWTKMPAKHGFRASAYSLEMSLT